MQVNNKIIIFVLLLLVVAFYFLGKKNGSNITRTNVVNNMAIIKEIAELGSLSVTGITTVKTTNKEEDGGMYSEFKNFFTEKTINISVPYEAKYGVDMSRQDVKLNSKAGTVTVYLPQVKLLSLQLRLNNMEAISKTGLLYTTTLDDFVKVEKTLYNAALTELENNANNKALAQNHIRFILEKYYAPVGLKVNCVFGAGKLLESTDMN
ncbi:MAG: DUF4230 domain-containing protein [Ferruginibacter sp.]